MDISSIFLQFLWFFIYFSLSKDGNSNQIENFGYNLPLIILFPYFFLYFTRQYHSIPRYKTIRLKFIKHCYFLCKGFRIPAAPVREERWERYGSLDNLTAPERTGTISRHNSEGNLSAALIPAAATVDPGPNQVMNSVLTEPTFDDHSGMELETVSDSRANLGTGHHQCSAARRAALRVEAISISADATFGTTVTAEPELVGTLNPPGDVGVLRTYHGARSTRAGQTINQSISVSFDPSSLICFTCPTEHKVITMDKPGVMMLSDQNFVPVWPGTVPEGCVSIIRVDNPTLIELSEFFDEIFGNTVLPEGTVLLVGSTSYLHRVGVGAYAREWTRLVGESGRRWPGVRVGPLIPIIREDMPGNVSREIIELAFWYHRMYTGMIHGLTGPWTMLVNKLIAFSAGGTCLTSPDNYTLSLPSSLDENSSTKPITYCCNSSRPSLLKKFDQGTICELLHAMLSSLERDFNISLCVGNLPVSTLPNDQ